ncbi:MAG: Aldo/keto reductase family protein [Firmicutes bacterium]|nr:Aldo/keto reductase family protein [Bacillota bacterium]
MKKRLLGKTGIEVTEISFGGLPIQRCNMEEAGVVLHAVLDAGINFIDTARAYTDSEAKIGCHLADRRKEYFLASKSMARDRAGMAKDIDLSLAAMKTNYIDLYQVHNIKGREDLDAVLAPGGALEALKEAQKAGKIGHIGITGHTISLLIEGLRTGEFSTVQVPFNCIEQQALEELFPLAKAMNIGRIVMKPLGGGQLEQIDLALRFILEHDISTAIPGMDQIEQIQQNAAASEKFRPLSDQERQELLQEAKILGPNFCRRCGYCMPCAVGIDIPTTFIFHLQYTRYGMKDAISKRYATFSSKASDCIECGVCEERCPYDIPIRERMKQIARELG